MVQHTASACKITESSEYSKKKEGRAKEFKDKIWDNGWKIRKDYQLKKRWIRLKDSEGR